MLFKDTRSEIEAAKNAVRNYVASIFEEKESITAKDATFILDSCKQVSLQLSMDIPEADLKMREELNILDIDNIFNIVDHYIEINFSSLNLSKLTEDFIYARKEAEKSDKETTEAKEEAPDDKISEEDIDTATNEFINDTKNELAKFLDCEKNEINLDEKIANSFIRSLSKIKEDKEEDLKILLKEELVSIINGAMKNIVPKIENLCSIESHEETSNENNTEKTITEDKQESKETESKDNTAEKETTTEDKEEEKNKTPLIYEEDIDLLNKLDVPMSPMNFSNKNQCKKYIDKKLAIYKELTGKFNLSKDKLNKIIELKLPIKVNENSTTDSILKEIETYKNGSKNTAPQLREFCINLAKLEDIIFYS